MPGFERNSKNAANKKMLQETPRQFSSDFGGGGGPVRKHRAQANCHKKTTQIVMRAI
jgi:hypothetical protein